MKLRSIGFVFVFLIWGMNVYADTECKTKLTKQDRYDDLNKTLQCLSSKIQKLEQRIVAQKNNIARSVSVGKVASDNSPAPVNYTFRDENFLVTLKKCTKKGKKINCTVKYENTSGANIEIRIENGATYMVDGDGERWDYERNTAISYWTKIMNDTYLPTKFIFNAQGSTTGEMFSLFVVNKVLNGETFQMTFNDVYLN